MGKAQCSLRAAKNLLGISCWGFVWRCSSRQRSGLDPQLHVPVCAMESSSARAGDTAGVGRDERRSISSVQRTQSPRLRVHTCSPGSASHQTQQLSEGGHELLCDIEILDFQLPLSMRGPCLCSKAGQGEGGIRCPSGYFEVSRGGVTCPDEQDNGLCWEGGEAAASLRHEQVPAHSMGFSMPPSTQTIL